MEFLGYCPYQRTRSLGDQLPLHRRYQGFSYPELAKILESTLSRWGAGDSFNCYRMDRACRKRVVPSERLGRLSLRSWGTSKIEQRPQRKHDANDRGQAQNFCKHVFPLLEAMKKDGGIIPILLPQNMGIN